MVQATSVSRPPLVMLIVGAVASIYAWAVFASTFRYPGAIGLNYITPGTDYMVFFTAIGLARRGDIATLYDGDRFTALLNLLFAARLHEIMPFRPWIYPPSFLILLLPFVSLGFFASYVSFQIVTAAAMAFSLRFGNVVDRSRWGMVVACLVCPAGSVAVVSGQCSFLVAALLTSGVGLLTRRPLAAGFLFGLLTFKPQFCLMLPVVLLAARAWRAMAAACATALGLAAVSATLFGSAIWTKWLVEISQSNAGTDPRWLLYGRIWGNSVYACATLLGATPRLATVAQYAAMALAAVCVGYVFRAAVPTTLRLAVLLAAVLLAAPHSGGYDLVMLVMSCGLFLIHAQSRASSADWLLGFVIWLEPLFGQPALFAPSRFGPAVTMLLIGRMLWLERAVGTRPQSPAVAPG